MELQRPKTKYLHFRLFNFYFQIIITRLKRPQHGYKYLSFAFYIIDIKKDITILEKVFTFLNGKLKKSS